MLRITAGGFSFVARLEEEDAPETVAAFRRLLPLESRIIHVRWSGEAGWIPFGDLDLGLGPENATCYPHPGEIVLYPGGVSRDGDPARLRLRQLRLEGRPAGGQPLRDDRRGQREPARARQELPLGRRPGDRLRGARRTAETRAVGRDSAALRRSRARRAAETRRSPRRGGAARRRPAALVAVVLASARSRTSR